MSAPEIITAGYYKDHRGTLNFCNVFDFKDIKRFYTIKHSKVTSIRAWQYHKKEIIYFFPIMGEF